VALLEPRRDRPRPRLGSAPFLPDRRAGRHRHGRHTASHAVSTSSWSSARC